MAERMKLNGVKRRAIPGLGCEGSTGIVTVLKVRYLRRRCDVQVQEYIIRMHEVNRGPTYRPGLSCMFTIRLLP